MKPSTKLQLGFSDLRDKSYTTAAACSVQRNNLLLLCLHDRSLVMLVPLVANMDDILRRHTREWAPGRMGDMRWFLPSAKLAKVCIVLILGWMGEMF